MVSSGFSEILTAIIGGVVSQLFHILLIVGAIILSRFRKDVLPVLMIVGLGIVVVSSMISTIFIRMQFTSMANYGTYHIVISIGQFIGYGLFAVSLFIFFLKYKAMNKQSSDDARSSLDEGV